MSHFLLLILLYLLLFFFLLLVQQQKHTHSIYMRIVLKRWQICVTRWMYTHTSPEKIEKEKLFSLKPLNNKLYWGVSIVLTCRDDYKNSERKPVRLLVLHLINKYELMYCIVIKISTAAVCGTIINKKCFLWKLNDNNLVHLCMQAYLFSPLLHSQQAFFMLLFPITASVTKPILKYAHALFCETLNATT